MRQPIAPLTRVGCLIRTATSHPLHSSDDGVLDQQAEDDAVHDIRNSQPTIAQKPLSRSSDTGN